MSEFPPGKVCFYRPARKEKRVYTPRDVGRIVAYSRNDGADDILLIAYILQSFGLRSIQCLLFKILDILNTAVFLTAIIAVLKGMLSVSKGLKILALGKKSRLTLNIIEQFLPKRFNKSLAAFLLWTGSVELAAGTLIIFLTAIANNVALYLLMKGVCEAEVAPLKIEVSSLDISTLGGDIDDAVTVLRVIIEDNI
jgi:hypothetical protein